MPRSIFLGRPLPAPGEPLWTDEDRAWAYALREVEADACPDCGKSWAEASDPDLEYGWRAHVVRCHACAAGGRAMRSFQDGGGDTRGLHVIVTREE